MYFSTQDKCRDIFDVFFSPSIARVKKYVTNVERFVVCRKIVKTIEKTRGKANCLGYFH